MYIQEMDNMQIVYTKSKCFDVFFVDLEEI